MGENMARKIYFITLWGFLVGAIKHIGCNAAIHCIEKDFIAYRLDLILGAISVVGAIYCFDKIKEKNNVYKTKSF